MAKQEISMNDLTVSIGHSIIEFYNLKRRSTWANNHEHAGSLQWCNSILGFRIDAYSYTEKAVKEYLQSKGIRIRHDSNMDYISYEDYIGLITLTKLKGG